jgi:hypothetical protein
MPQSFDREERAERWRALAVEAATTARQARDPESKRLLAFIAEAYDRLAQRARGQQYHSG